METENSVEQRTAEERLRWFLLDLQPSMIGDYDIWEHIEADASFDEGESDEGYLRHCYKAIDAAMDAALPAGPAAGEQ